MTPVMAIARVWSHILIVCDKLFTARNSGGIVNTITSHSSNCQMDLYLLSLVPELKIATTCGVVQELITHTLSLAIHCLCISLNYITMETT